MNSCSSCVINNWRIEQISRKRLMLRAFRLFFLSITFSFYTSAHVSITSMKKLILTFIFSLKARAWHRSNMIMCNSFLVLSDKKGERKRRRFFYCLTLSSIQYFFLMDRGIACYISRIFMLIFFVRGNKQHARFCALKQGQVNTNDFRAKLVPS